MQIIAVNDRCQAVLQELLRVWENSVRQSHDFLKEADIEELRPLVLQGLAEIEDLRAIQVEDGTYAGFMGIEGKKLEMLFINGDQRGLGLGAALLKLALCELGVVEVDVNEQNKLALRFYQKHGFCQFARSALDGQGKPFPILHLRLADKKQS